MNSFSYADLLLKKHLFFKIGVVFSSRMIQIKQVNIFNFCRVKKSIFGWTNPDFVLTKSLF